MHVDIFWTHPTSRCTNKRMSSRCSRMLFTIYILICLNINCICWFELGAFHYFVLGETNESNNINERFQIKTKQTTEWRPQLKIYKTYVECVCFSFCIFFNFIWFFFFFFSIILLYYYFHVLFFYLFVAFYLQRSKSILLFYHLALKHFMCEWISKSKNIEFIIFIWSGLDCVLYRVESFWLIALWNIQYGLMLQYDKMLIFHLLVFFFFIFSSMSNKIHYIHAYKLTCMQNWFRSIIVCLVYCGISFIMSIVIVNCKNDIV